MKINVAFPTNTSNWTNDQLDSTSSYHAIYPSIATAALLTIYNQLEILNPIDPTQLFKLCTATLITYPIYAISLYIYNHRMHTNSP